MYKLPILLRCSINRLVHSISFLHLILNDDYYSKSLERKVFFVFYIIVIIFFISK